MQTHPIVQKADIRRKFPDEIHLIVGTPAVAMLKISQEINDLSHGTLQNVNYFLIGHDQRLLKQMPLGELVIHLTEASPLFKGLTFHIRDWVSV
ncbi:MAG: hypothetical protein CM1200mP28_14010 [Deltaproteobacteria bacterium]|nr:MAG: hypothetical protein CM1200mP28_14010 [Deltaproteobacteria bacterium]